jgi:hypothetical protein
MGRNIIGGDGTIEATPGQPFTVSVPVQGWSQAAVAALSHPDWYSYVSAEFVNDDNGGDGRSLYPVGGSPGRPGAVEVTQDGQVVSFHFQIPPNFAVGSRWVLFVKYSDALGASTQLPGTFFRRNLRVVAPAASGGRS